MEHVTSQELRKRLDAGESLTLLDIREQDELAICRLDGSVHFPMFSVPLRIEEVRALLPVVVYCHHGVRSLQLCHYLEQQGVIRFTIW